METFDYSAVGARIKALRKKKHLNQIELANLIGKSLRTVQKYETGEIEVSVGVVNDLAKVLDSTPTYILGYDTEVTPITSMADVLNYCDKNFKSFYFEGRVAMHKRYDYPEIGERLGRIIDYIYEHHSEKLSLRELAKKEHFSEAYLSKLITAGTGLGFRELLAFARVEESEIILLSGSEKISSIAAKVGSSTTAYYEKFFQKWFGCHPEEYREKYADRIKGNSPELVFELSESDALSIIQKSIQNLSFESGGFDAGRDEAQNLLERKREQQRKEILEAYEKTNRSHEEILRFMLGSADEDEA